MPWRGRLRIMDFKNRASKVDALEAFNTILQDGEVIVFRGGVYIKSADQLLIYETLRPVDLQILEGIPGGQLELYLVSN